MNDNDKAYIRTVIMAFAAGTVIAIVQRVADVRTWSALWWYQTAGAALVGLTICYANWRSQKRRKQR